MAEIKPKEQDLYAPVKALLEAQGYEVKGEVGAADVVAVRENEAPVVVELKLAFSLALIHQGIARQSLTDAVYLAVPRGSGRRWMAAMKQHRTLCRRLGLGLIYVRLSDGHTQIALDPAPYQPRKSAPRKARLLREFARREGDPNTGGAARNGTIVTAYRQDCIRLAQHLAANGPCKGAHVASATGVEKATRMMADDHYGWFKRVGKGIYALTPNGAQAVAGKVEGQGLG
ncbi:hypothetical protein FHY55_06010 [Oceanicola sp. D3]|uniref:DUF2161 domain-containing phosphodiesterase n=1 Tax=Oceanicola sp. D3 TaxID=2587163 RepID=UPI0011214A7C|nr:DUF2161 family putative PD-(D/E)XK-type phosphodiesterase [Oceanicola sp. D3]QDC08820.1 hypothetical protein FHY55_06010 [Oceanicola sp. D3]